MSSVFIVDNSAGIELARWFTKWFNPVYYFYEWRQGGFPKSAAAMVGEGIEGVIRVKSLDEYVLANIIAKEKGEKLPVDLWVFTDCYEGDKQTLIEHFGFDVFGSRYGEEIELDREGMKDLLQRKEIGLTVGKYKVLQGIDKLSDYLKINDNQFIKISTFRGDMESFKALNFKDRENYLDSFKDELGQRKNTLRFISEDELPDMVEIGMDLTVCDGDYPEKIMCGIEMKDAGYLSTVKPYSELPKELTIVTDKLRPYFKHVGYKGFFSIEIRIGKEKKPYPLDACTRFGYPTVFSQIFGYKNISTIFSECAKGNPVSPETDYKYFCELVIKSEWAKQHELRVDVPEKYRDNFFFKQITVINGEIYIIPQPVGMEEIGSVVAGGNTIEEAFKNVEKIGRELKSSEISIGFECFDKFRETIKQMDEFDINFFK